MLDGFVKLELLNRNQHTTEIDYNEVFIRYNPSVGDMAGKRFTDTHAKQGSGIFNLSKEDVLFDGSKSSATTKNNLNSIKFEGIDN